jgi:diamine N-acetyltransferase
MGSSLIIRFGDSDDLNTIGFLAQQTWPQTYSAILPEEQLRYMMDLFYSPSSLKKQMLEQGHIFLIIEDGDEPVGFASYSQINSDGIYKLHKIYVLPGRQGKGLGKAIIDFIIEDIRPKSATALQLNVNRHNKAKDFYQRLGFTVIHEEDNDIGNNYFMNDYVMERKLVDG